MKPETHQALFEYLLRLGDDQLVLGQRLCEWCGHAPILEEDIALGNISLDCFGQASAMLRLAGTLEGQGRDEDKLAYFRSEREFRNCMLVEQPNGDFGVTIARQFLFDAYAYLLYEELAQSSHPELAALAAKALKEIRYHLRHSSQWVIRLGDGTAESHQRIQDAFESLWSFTAELFQSDQVEQLLAKQKIASDSSALKPKWDKLVTDVLTKATLKIPDSNRHMHSGARQGRHSEHLGHMLSEMQILARSHPGAVW